MELFLLKCTVMPSLIYFISYLQRRLGHHIGGMLTGLPLNIAPINAFLYVERGHAYVQKSAEGNAIGMVAVIVFVVVYLLSARRRGWLPSLLIASSLYPLTAFALQTYGLPPLAALIVCIVLLLLFIIWLYQIPRPKTAISQTIPLWPRAIAAVIFLVATTALSSVLPSNVIGLIAISPVLNSIMLCFSHHDYGADSLPRLALGSATGMLGTTSFLAVLIYMPLGTSGTLTFACAIICAVLTSACAQAVMAVSAHHFKKTAPESQ